LKRAAKITASSHFLAKATAAYAPPGKHIEVIPFGIYTDVFSRSGENRRKGNELILGFVKHLEAKYGVHYLLQAMPAVLEKFPTTRLLLIGSGELEDELKKLASELEISAQIQFVGHIPNEKLPAYLEQMDVFVMPSLVEAQAMQIPVVASRVGGIPEAVSDGITGILVPPMDSEAIASAIKKLLASAELRRNMGREGRNFVIEKYEWDKCAQKMEELYHSLMGGQRC
jgi:glycosyltransferase involved in cell wall biosynthesis